MQKAQVIKLDRGYPLVRCEDGKTIRCEHATALVKGVSMRAVVGDYVEVEIPAGHDKGVIQTILPRERAFVRKDPTERALPQVLAANFDRVFVAQPLADINIRRLERELVLAYETDAKVTVILTKADLAENEEHVTTVRNRVNSLVGPDIKTLVVSENNPSSIEEVRALIPPNTTAILLGKSGVGKSSLVNMLVGFDMQETTPVRDDGKGRHTTVSREMVSLPGGGYIIDMPGVRGLGLWDADAGIGAAFADIEELVQQCKFRDCQHQNEPGCAVRAAVDSGTISEERFTSYQTLKQETADLRVRREEARRMRGEKASHQKSGNKKPARCKAGGRRKR